MTSRLTLSVVAAATFLAGFGAAELTGVRAVGGLVLLAGGIWCVRLALRLAGAGPTVALVAIALALFALSHPLGRAIGGWPAVLVSAALVAAAAGAITRIWPKAGSRTADGPERAGSGLGGVARFASASAAARSDLGRRNVVVQPEEVVRVVGRLTSRSRPQVGPG